MKEMLMCTLHQQLRTVQQARNLEKNSRKKNMQKLLSALQFKGRSLLLPIFRLYKESERISIQIYKNALKIFNILWSDFLCHM